MVPIMSKQIRQPRNIMPRLSGELWARLTDTLNVPPGWDIFVTHSNKGYARSNSQTCTVPFWSVDMSDAERYIHHNDPDHATYYLAHELAHAWTYVNGGNIRLHGDDFYKEFKRLCPPELWHYELQYKTRDARRAGIDPVPANNVKQARPNDAVPVHVTYGHASTHETEGDLYESVTGHRSQPIDNSELRRAAIKRDPNIESKLATMPDHEVKSYISGWFKKPSKA